MSRNTIPFFCVLFLLFFAYTLFAQDFSQLALTPPMGWNSWNYFGCNVSESLIKQIADAMASSGMKEAGYQYIVIDDCWQTSRDDSGYIVADPVRFPSGIKALADYVHSLGLKFGLYSCAGTKTCAGRPGSKGYEYKDAQRYAEWGVDYLKYDWCYTEGQNSRTSYQLMRNALEAAGRPIVFSICEWGSTQPWLWARGIGHLWRTTGDIQPTWESIMHILDLQVGLEKYAGPGGWNDPDMLEVGNGQLTYGENRAHFSLWCLLSAPLMAGNDLRNMRPDVLEILTNREVIAVNQDSLGIQGSKIRDDGDYEVWAKLLKDSSYAIILLNRSTKAKEISVNWKEIGFPQESFFRVRDLWKKEDQGYFQGFYSASVPSHDVVMVRVWPVSLCSEVPQIDWITPEDSTRYTFPAHIELRVQSTQGKGNILQVAFFANGENIGIDETPLDGWSLLWNPEKPGVYQVVACAKDNSGISVTSKSISLYLSPSSGPFLGYPISLPGRIEAENYDGGGEGVGYHDTDAQNRGGWYRWDGVDIELTEDETPGYCVSDLESGEWLNYTVHVSESEAYDLSVRTTSSVRSGKYHIELDGVNLTGSQTVPYTGSQANWTTVKSMGLSLPEGIHTLRFYIESGGFELNFLDFAYALKALPSPWQHQDIGSPSVKGDAGIRKETFVIQASGRDIWDTRDAFHFVYQQGSGDLEIQAKVLSLTKTDPWAKAGVMIRNTLDANSEHAMMVVTAEQGLAFQRRIAQGGTSFHTPGKSTGAPYWVKLVRRKNNFSAYESADGVVWNRVGAENIVMNDPVYVGLVVTAHHDGAICEAYFEKVSMTLLSTAPSSETDVPVEFKLGQNYLNPFNPDTTIEYEIPQSTEVLIRIYNLSGQEIVTLVHEKSPPGHYKIQWDGKDALGREVSSGVYVFQLKAGEFQSSRKLLFLK